MPKHKIILMVIIAGITLSMSAPAQADIVYFLVADPLTYPLGLGDSYILPLTEQADIDLARTIIAGGGFKIVTAYITNGSGGYNRDVLAPGQPPWSWHVSEFDGFSDFAVEYCDGSPTYTELGAANWAPGTVEQICYWSYTVVAELQSVIPTENTTWGAIKAILNAE